MKRLVILALVLVLAFTAIALAQPAGGPGGGTPLPPTGSGGTLGPPGGVPGGLPGGGTVQPPQPTTPPSGGGGPASLPTQGLSSGDGGICGDITWFFSYPLDERLDSQQYVPPGIGFGWMDPLGNWRYHSPSDKGRFIETYYYKTPPTRFYFEGSWNFCDKPDLTFGINFNF